LGAAIGVFEGAGAIEVDRSRFLQHQQPLARPGGPRRRPADQRRRPRTEGDVRTFRIDHELAVPATATYHAPTRSGIDPLVRASFRLERAPAMMTTSVPA